MARTAQSPHGAPQQAISWALTRYPARLSIGASAVAGLLEALKAVTEGAPEECGLLLGRSGEERTPAGPGRVLYVDAFEPVPPEEWSETISRRRASHRTTVLGFYCLQPGGVDLRERERDLAYTFFSHADRVGLVLSSQLGVPRAALNFWNNGELATESVSPFPPPGGPESRTSPGQEELPMEMERHHDRAVLARAEDREGDSARAVHAPLASRLGPWWLLAAVAVIAMVGLAVGVFWRRDSLPYTGASINSPLGLRVDQEAADRLIVRWDRRAPPIASGGKGSLHITDGANTRVVELEQRDLVTTGSIIYRTATDRVRIELQVESPQGSVSEAVRVISGVASGTEYAMTRTPADALRQEPPLPAYREPISNRGPVQSPALPATPLRAPVTAPRGPLSAPGAVAVPPQTAAAPVHAPVVNAPLVEQPAAPRSTDTRGDDATRPAPEPVAPRPTVSEPPPAPREIDGTKPPSPATVETPKPQPAPPPAQRAPQQIAATVNAAPTPKPQPPPPPAVKAPPQQTAQVITPGPVAPPVAAPPKAVAPKPEPRKPAQAPEPVVAPNVVEPPKLIKKTIPQVPATLSRYVQADHTVTVELYLNDRGTVQSAAAVKRGSPILERIAEDAAKQLVYTPARVDGRAVGSRATVTYSFTKSGAR